MLARTFRINSNDVNVYRSQLYQRVASHLRIAWSPPQKVQIPDDRADSYTNAIRKHTTPDVQFNVTIMPTRFVTAAWISWIEP